MMYLMVFPMTLLGALGAYLFKCASGKTTGLFQLFTCRELYVGGVLYVASALLNIVLLKYLAYSILYPMTAITYIWSALLSSKLLGETIGKKGLIGIACVWVGVLFLTF